MTNDGFGKINDHDGLPRVTFERVLEAAIDAVWAMLTTNDGLEKWLAPASVELRLGGAMDIDFGDGGVVGGEIIDLVPGVALEYRWRFTGEPDSVIRFDLEVIDDETTKLKLDHRLLPTDQAVGYGAGWHAHLDKLNDVLNGREPGNWSDRFTALMPEYERLTA